MVALANRLNDIAPFYVMDILSKAKALEAKGEDIIHLEVGEPDFPDLPEVAQAGANAILAGNTKYTASAGLIELREKLSQYYQSEFNTTINPNRIFITPGASSGLMLALSLILDTSDTMVITEPGYPCNQHFIDLLGAKHAAIPIDARQNFKVTQSLIEQYWTAANKGLLIASPANPTGAVLDDEEIHLLTNHANKIKSQLIVDEIYQGLTHNNSNSTALSVSDQTIVINSFSKFFSMTGWRIGWIVVPEHMIEAADKLAQNLYLSAPTPAQYAAIRALDDDCIQQFKQRAKQFTQRRDYLLPELKKLGFKIEQPCDGAFYIYADASAFTKDSMQFCQDLLEHTGVAITPGKDFRGFQSNQMVRIAYTSEIARLKQAIERISIYLKGLIS
ncbi:aminotransferase class I/II-fold pyridoxal phosphate-dependent enzyme [Marinicellulosiphila megalodicopiae]|uniref:aminotransferase class I/II-fold pyridoxal phosphate-dependent enzyme n=1 Tax=Marinicellulosiphila megalodicopiae TaxID=2724896 RepID=UPI003BB012C3